MHDLIAVVSALFVYIKAIGVLHDKFASTHDAEPGSYFVPELGLNLVEVDGHLFV